MNPTRRQADFGWTAMILMIAASTLFFGFILSEAV
jgi:hypothetical protein